ncbi:uncharacterized protein LOC144543891 [Carex rostrata]
MRQDKSGSHFDIGLSRLFNDFVQDHLLVEHKLPSRKYTWSNGRQFALLDRIFTTPEWDAQYPDSSISDLSCNASDHCPIILQTHTMTPPNTPSFKFDPLWLQQEDFLRLLPKWWQEKPLQPPNIAKTWTQKLNHVRKRIKGWTKNFYGARKKEKQQLLSLLHDFELIRENRDLTQVEEEEWILYTNLLDDIYHQEEESWKMKSKQKWLDAGDANTKFFHTVATHRSKKIRINTLEINGQLTSDPDSIQQHILTFYKDLLGTPGLKFGFLDDQFWDLEDKLTSLEQWSLERPFTEEELKKALFASEPNGAPGPDGFTQNQQILHLPHPKRKRC